LPRRAAERNRKPLWHQINSPTSVVWKNRRAILNAGKKPSNNCSRVGRGSSSIYRDLAQRFPGIVNLWFEFGTAAAADLDFVLAIQAFERAETLAATNPDVLVMLGQQSIGSANRSRPVCFQCAVEADPSSTHAV